MSIQFFGPNPNCTPNFRSFKRYLMRPLELRSWAVREAISDLQLKKPFSAFSQLSLQFSHFFRNNDPPQNFILHLWTNFHTFRVHRTKVIASQRPRKLDPRETILRIFRKFLRFWCLRATWTIIKVICLCTMSGLTSESSNRLKFCCSRLAAWVQQNDVDDGRYVTFLIIVHLGPSGPKFFSF